MLELYVLKDEVIVNNLIATINQNMLGIYWSKTYYKPNREKSEPIHPQFLQNTK